MRNFPLGMRLSPDYARNLPVFPAGTSRRRSPALSLAVPVEEQWS
jgi:hypothetical protein